MKLLSKLFPNFFKQPKPLSVEDQIKQELNSKIQAIELSIFKQQVEVAVHKAELHRLITLQSQYMELSADQEATSVFVVGQNYGGNE
jgi:hypothetical protein